MGLKFGIHVMRGISAQAVNAGTPILDVIKGGAFVKGDRKWLASDIGMRELTCGWLKGFMSVDTDTEAGRAFLRSLYRQYASWGVDFVKLDCVFGEDLSSKEIFTVSELLGELDRPVVFSISPGARVTPSMAEGIRKHVNMYRITGDDWDKWKDVASHFNVSRDFAAAKRIGAKGLNGRSWPDLDMLPFGWLTDPGVPLGPHRKCNLTSDEQKTQITLWSMAKSPLMFGGDVRKLDTDTYNLITNPVILEINSYSSNNMELPFVTGKKTYHNVAQKSSIVDAVEPTVRRVRSWIATGREGEVYVSFFNLEAETMLISVGIEDLAKVLGLNYVSNGWCEGSEVWSGSQYTFEKSIDKMVQPHGCALFVFKC